MCLRKVFNWKNITNSNFSFIEETWENNFHLSHYFVQFISNIIPQRLLNEENEQNAKSESGF